MKGGYLMSSDTGEKTIFLVITQLLGSFVAGIFTYGACKLMIHHSKPFLLVALGIGGGIAARLIVGAWCNAMIRAQKNPMIAAALFLVMAILASVGLILNFA